MKLSRALSIFGYRTSKDINRSELKKKYRYLIKSNHPDSNKHPTYRVQDIKEALESLEKYCKFIERYSKEYKPKFIGIKELIELYKYKETEYNGEKFERSDLKKGSTFLDVGYRIKIDGIENIQNEYIFYNVSDKYKINIDIPITEGSEHEIEFELEKITKKVNLGKYDVSFKINFDYNIEFVVSLHRKVLHEENKNA